MHSTALLLIALALPAQAQERAVDAISGVSDLSWGTELETATGEAEGYVDLPGESPSEWMGLETSQLQVAARGGRLVGLRFVPDGRVGRELKARLGRPDRTGNGKWFWIGEQVKLSASAQQVTVTYTGELEPPPTEDVPPATPTTGDTPSAEITRYTDARCGALTLRYVGPSDVADTVHVPDEGLLFAAEPIPSTAALAFKLDDGWDDARPITASLTAHPVQPRDSLGIAVPEGLGRFYRLRTQVGEDQCRAVVRLGRLRGQDAGSTKSAVVLGVVIGVPAAGVLALSVWAASGGVSDLFTGL